MFQVLFLVLFVFLLAIRLLLFFVKLNIRTECGLTNKLVLSGSLGAYYWNIGAF